MDNHRVERISAALREELGEMIAYELADPRVAEATVTEVLVSPDMKRAQVRLHVGNGTNSGKEVIAALDGAKHFLRRQLAERMNLFRVPDLHFEADDSIGSGARLASLMKRVRKGRPRDEDVTER